MYEVEVKAHLRDRVAVIKKLKSFGCKFSKELHQVDSIFLPEGSPFPNPLGTPVLRVRKQNDQYFLTLKISQSGRQDSLERELEIKDGDMMKEILKLLKWYQVPTVDKKRIKTKLRDIEIVLDTVKHLGEFMEAEKIVKNKNHKDRIKIQEELCDFLVSIGIPREDLLVNYKYDIMLEEKFGLR